MEYEQWNFHRGRPEATVSRYSRPIYVRGSNIKVLSTPREFYGALLRGVETAKKRVVLSSLYLGTGEQEQELVRAIHRAISDDARPHLRCSILLDCLRGTRGRPNSVSMLQPLLSGHHSHRVSLHLYHTPNLRGWVKRVFPERFNEGMGLQHMKIYIFDNSLLLSGANLSRDYFTDRQDRYILFSDSQNLADFFSKLAATVAAHSCSVAADMSMNPGVGFDPLASTANSQKYIKILSENVRKLLILNNRHEDLQSPDISSGSDVEYDTAVFPLVQMGQYGIRQEEEVTTRLKEGVERDERLHLASGYFNLPPKYIRALLQAEGDISLLAASPQAFGFFGARGIAGHVPVMYTHFAKQFLRKVCRHGCEERVKYSEYFREGWTFHGKGLWYYLAGEPLPSLTLIGSSNYGHRSLSRDLEAQIAVVTSNQKLREALHMEQQQMFAHSHSLTLSDMECAPDRKLKLWQWIVTSLLKPHV